MLSVYQLCWLFLSISLCRYCNTGSYADADCKVLAQSFAWFSSTYLSAAHSVSSFKVELNANRCGYVLLSPAPIAGALSGDARLTSVCLSRTSGLSREQRGLGRLKLAQRQPTSHVTQTPLSRSKGQRSTCRGGGILWRPPAQLCFDMGWLDMPNLKMMNQKYKNGNYITDQNMMDRVTWHEDDTKSSFLCQMYTMSIKVAMIDSWFIRMSFCTVRSS